MFQLTAEIAHHHHEKWNGSGYPDGLTKTSIPESARIVAVADVFDALTMARLYKKAWTTDEAAQQLKIDAGSHFDPHIIEVFSSILPEILDIKAHWDAREKA